MEQSMDNRKREYGGGDVIAVDINSKSTTCKKPRLLLMANEKKDVINRYDTNNKTKRDGHEAASATATTPESSTVDTIAVSKTSTSKSKKTGILDLTDDLIVLLFRFVGGEGGGGNKNDNDEEEESGRGYYYINKHLIAASTKFYRVYKSRLFVDDLKLRITKERTNKNLLVQIIKSKEESIVSQNEIIHYKNVSLDAKEQILEAKERIIVSNNNIVSSLRDQLESQRSIINSKDEQLQINKETIQSQKGTISSLNIQLRALTGGAKQTQAAKFE